jgi:hypothetical protein
MIDEGTAAVQMILKAQDAPNKIVESTIWFHGDYLESRVYYDELGARIVKENPDNIFGLLRVLNFINERVFLSCGDPYGLYHPHLLFTPRIYLEEDSGTVAIVTTINYDFYEVAPVEAVDYITAFCPELLNMLVAPVLFTAAGKLTADKAIEFIEERILTD